MFTLAKDLLRRQIEAEDIGEIGQRDTSDELHAVIWTAQDSRQKGGAAIKSTADETISVYPDSNSEDNPLIAVRRGALVLLGNELELGDGKGVEATVTAISDAVDIANGTLEILDREIANRLAPRQAER